MSGLRSRRKGHGFEREVARRFRDIMPDAAENIRRGWQSRYGHDEPDVIVPFFTVECKAQKQPNIRAALAQAEENNKEGLRWPAAICKSNRQEPTVTMRLDDWLELVKQWYERGKQ